MIGLSPFLIFVIVAVTAAQLAGNGKRKNKKSGNNNENPNKYTLGKRTLIKKTLQQEFADEGKIQAEPEPPSFEVDADNRPHVDGFDVK